jgi:hypothetical protein
LWVEESIFDFFLKQESIAMNKFFIGLLIVVIGAGGYYFFLRKKDKPISATEINKELIVGKWKVEQDSVSNFYEFQRDGDLLRSSNDSTKADTTFYEWNKSNELVWKETKDDSTNSKVFSVTKLNADSLVLQTKDSAVFYFTKVK